jgi:acyl-CoA synthetase (AMP-forming)/AMP-acid ligase II
MAHATIAALFDEIASGHPDHPFLAVLPGTAAAYGITAGEVSYGHAAREIAALRAAYREAGYGIGHRVGILVENRPCHLLHFLALNALGVSLVPINPDLRSAELEYLIAHSEVAAIVAIPARRAMLAQAARDAGCKVAVFAPDAEPPVVEARSGVPDADSECALLYTSGTTGRPKGCVLANSYFLRAGQWYRDIGGLLAMQTGCERMLTPLPLFHMNAMAYSAIAMIATGGCLIVLDRFHPSSWWRDVCESQASIVHYLGVMPPMLMGAAPAPADTAHQVRFGFGAGADRALHAAFEARFGFPLIEAWAMTETGAGAVIVASREPRHVGTGCFGRPESDVAIRIVLEDGSDAACETPGELLVRHAGPDPRHGFFQRYLKDAPATEAAWQGGWFHTGDVVRRMADGSLCFIDRKKNVIRRSGENIAAVEVESVLLQHPSIAQVAVAPVADPVRGEEVFALVVAPHSPDTRAAMAADIVAFCLDRLAYYKAPGYVAFVAAVPLTTTQKIQRGQLKDLVAASLAGDACIDTRSLKRRQAV